jgi:nitrogen fixation/metabolism regulation signal transduction histidine kinase
MQTRKKKLVRNDIQLKLALTFTLLTSMALVLQFMLFLATMTGKGLDESGLGRAHAEIVDATLMALALSAVVVLPLTLMVGILATHRFAGPIVAFRNFLEAIARGDKPQDMRLRKGDQLQDLCELLNRATAPMRRDEQASDSNVSEIRKVA